MSGLGEDSGNKILMVERLSLSFDSLVSHVPLACSPSYCAVPSNRNDLLVYSHQNTAEKPLRLCGNHGEVGALEFGAQGTPALLCSASADYVIVWDLDRCSSRSRRGLAADGTVVGTLLGTVVHLSFSSSDQRVSACCGSYIYILSSQQEKVGRALKGHRGPVTAAEFCPWDQDTLVSTGEDRTFMVWDVNKEAVLYLSGVLSASPLLSIAFLGENRQLVTGSADGQVWCFSLPGDSQCRTVSRLDLHKAQQRHQQRHQQRYQQQLERQAQNTGVEKQPGSVEMDRPVLTMCSLSCSSRYCSPEQSSWVWLGSSDGLYLIDLATSEILTTLCFRDDPSLNITLAGSWSFCQGRDNNVVCLASSLFVPAVSVLEVKMPGSIDSLCANLAQAWPAQTHLSVLPSAPPIQNSPLNTQLRRKETKQPKKTGVREQPLVFHSQVRSSGYRQGPRRTMFSPKTNVPKTPGHRKPDHSRSLLRDYPSDTGAPSVLHTHLSTGPSPTPVCCCQYSGDGKQILCGMGDRSVLLYKSTLTGHPAVYTGHDKAVSRVCWSHSRQWWLSASEDRTVNIWSSSSPEPVLTLAADRFPKPIRAAQFYYLDRFLLLASGPSLLLYLLHLDGSRDSIKRYHQRSAVQLGCRLQTSASTDITSLSAVNSFHSYLVLACGADRSLQVMDLNQDTVAAQVPEAHSRAAHHITQNQGSMFSCQTPDSYNLFLTSAVTDGLKLWDLRSLRCVRRYGNHLNRCHLCTCAFSPCGRFICSGSEDGCAYVYDLRHSAYLHKLHKQSDVVLTATFNPATPELLTGTLDGWLGVFRPSDGASLPCLKPCPAMGPASPVSNPAQRWGQPPLSQTLPSDGASLPCLKPCPTMGPASPVSNPAQRWGQPPLSLTLLNDGASLPCL
ncbi:WD repeat-containing protein 27 [Osmerus eperlanus]|uniref:WD repeat-containing protein 27 n=1 Tax=Osmerus eperlanus TaxID=29151 RepID=UPI002E154037